MRRVALLVLCASVANLSAETFDLRGFLTGRGVYADGQPSWTRGGFGRFDAGGDGNTSAGIGELQLGADWQPVKHALVHVHGVARGQTTETRGGSGLVSAYAEGDWEFGRNELLVRGGQNFLGTSRENVADLWSSPYTINLSALNTWVAQEVRPIGINGEWRLLTSTALITTSLTAFRGNDAMGALLAWRGWTIGNRLAAYDEVLPLPPLRSLRDVFVRQSREGTKPFGPDLDGRTGYAARVRYAIPERFSIQLTRVDNRGDRRLHRGEYAWRTPFYVAGADAHAGNATFASEWMEGKTGMGDPSRASIDLKFYAAYLLGSYKLAKETLSARYEVFATLSQRPVEGDIYNEHGRAWTFTWLHEVARQIRAGLEFTQVAGTHDEAEDAGFSPVIDGRSVMVEVRMSFRAP